MRFSACVTTRFEGDVDGMEDEGAEVLVNVYPFGCGGDERANITLEVELGIGNMVVLDVDECIAAVIVIDCWAKLVAEAKELAAGSGTMAGGFSWPPFGGILCAGGPGIPPAALTS